MHQDDYSLDGTVHHPTQIIQPTNMTLPESSRIDSFCLVNASGGIDIGEEVHICAGTKIVGSGGLDVADRVGITYNCVILTSTADLRYPGSAEVPSEERQSISARVTLNQESFIGAGAVLMPGVELGEGAVVAANTYVDSDIPDWTIVLPDGSFKEREAKFR